MRLINLLPPIRNESLESYLARLGKANYYEERNWVNALVGLPRETHVDYLYSEAHLTRLSEIVRLSVQSLRSMTIHRFAAYFYSPETLLQLPSGKGESTEYPQWEEKGRNIFITGTYSHNKVCPSCLQEDNTVLLPWLLRPVTACLIHQALLIDTCSACDQRLRLDEGACSKCGTPVAQMPQTSIDDDMTSLNVTKLVWTAIGCSNSTFPLEEGFPFTELTPPLFLQLLWRLATLLLEYDPCSPYIQAIDPQKLNHNGRRKSLRHLDVRSYHQIMKAVYELLTGWPDNWHRALGRILQGEEARRDARLVNPKMRNRRSFPYALRKALGNITAWNWLWNSWAEFVQDCGSNLAGIRYWRSYLSRSQDKDNWHTRTSKPSSRWKNSPSLPSISNKPTKPTIQRSAHQAANSEQGKYALLSLVQAADYLGISKGKLIQLANSGLVSVEPRESPHSSVKWRFRQDHLDTALEKALKHLPLVPLPLQTERRRVLTLAEALSVVSFHRVSWINLLTAIIEDNLIAQREPDTPGLKGIWLYTEDLISFQEHWRFPDGILLHSIYTVMEVLKCGQRTLDHFARSGLLVPVKGYPSESPNLWYYNQQDIADFQERYITSDEAASSIGCTRRTLLSWVKQGKIEPASGPRINGVRIYRFDRQAVIRWRKERLTSSEAQVLLGISQRAMETWIAKGKLKPREDMGQHPLWFAREDIERIKAVQATTTDKQIPEELYNVCMAKRKFRLTEQQGKELLVAQTSCEDEQTRKRFQAVRLYGMGHSYGEVMETVGCGRSSLCTWCLNYQLQGIQGLLDKRLKQC